MDLYQDCLQSGGVLLTLPEHLNSFRLVGVDKLTADTRELARELIRVQKWLDCNARDLIDESDEILSQNYELVYTSGEASLLSGAPDRCTIALDILDVVKKNALSLHSKLAEDVEVESRGRGAFPHIRVLNDNGALVLTELVAQAVVDGKLPSLPLGSCNEDMLQAIRAFLLHVDVDESLFQLMSEHFQGSVKLDLLYVVRGLISYQILPHCLRKRWLVNYGLDRSRTLSAVPYRAKSIPSPSAEFAQPETAILLTALSFYYTGLLPSDLRRCLLMLLKTPDPADTYSKWVAQSTLPARYRKASSVNLDDAGCTEELYKHLGNNSEVIKFFLQYVVYPSEAKEFRHKLSTSAWDLCKQETVITSGFSGTCDSKIPVVQKDLDDLKYITASTLETLLRFENQNYYCASSSGRRLSTEELLRRIVSHGQTDVIIDVGAQMLEGNLEIAEMWLKLCDNKHKLAAIFFSENDEKMVVNRDGSVEAFVSSVFKDEIRSCLIFLDEFHTRGTDFSLPDNFKAAVLLGPGLLKDNLAQACMRMRKLAVSQCVRFYAPPEVDQSIRTTMKDPSHEIKSCHVVRWAIQQSCAALKKQGPMYATRGLLHSRRRIASSRHVLPSGDVLDPDTYLSILRERESRPVSELYRVGENHRRELPFAPSFEEQRDVVFKDLLVEFERMDLNDFKDSGITEEQEREILHEVEEEREIQRPKEVSAAVPSVSASLRRLIRDPNPPEGASDLLPAFEVLKQTRLCHHYKRLDFPMHVLATPDFFQTIQDSPSSDDFLRPVQWVLKAKQLKQPIIISAHEANLLLPEISKSKHVTLVIYQARVSRGMRPFDGMDVYNVPENNGPLDISPAAIAMLNLFAGQLYFSSFAHYKQLCLLIGLWDGETHLIKRQVDNENFVSPSCRKANGWPACNFKTSPVSILKAFIGMRRLGIEWSHTHMGRVLSGRVLQREDFEEDLTETMGDLNIDGGEEEAAED